MKTTALAIAVSILVLVTNLPTRAFSNDARSSAFQFDPDLQSDERDLVSDDLSRAEHFDFDLPPNSNFAKIFGGDTSADVMRYLRERISLFVSSQTNLLLRVSMGPTNATEEAYTLASNVGTMLWFKSLLFPPHQMAFRSGSAVLSVDSSRIGIVGIGNGYTAQMNGRRRFPQLARITALIHEARHSDCTGGLSRSDLKRLTSGEEPVNPSCGHLHVRCPAGHDYAGLYACDGGPWGAYAVGAVFTAGLTHCVGCSSEERSVAQIAFFDSLNRIIPLEEMLEGTLGEPDMTSSSEIREN